MLLWSCGKLAGSWVVLDDLVHVAGVVGATGPHTIIQPISLDFFTWKLASKSDKRGEDSMHKHFLKILLLLYLLMSHWHKQVIGAKSMDYISSYEELQRICGFFFPPIYHNFQTKTHTQKYSRAHTQRWKIEK